MPALKIAACPTVVSCFTSYREIVDIHHTDFTDIAVVVLSLDDIKSGKINTIKQTGFNLPIFIAINAEEILSAGVLATVDDVFTLASDNNHFYGKQVEAAALKYESLLLPPFFAALKKYVEAGNSSFASPGHQGGQFYRKHPAGRQFFEFFGETLFRADVSNSDLKMGDLQIHEGAPCAAEQHAAKVFNADKTYFVLNGTSSANKVVTNALLTEDDLVLFDRNNHKSAYHGALLQAGATPIYLPTTRNPLGLIGGIDALCFSEQYLREQIAEVAPERAGQTRPFRLAIIQLGTYDGVIYNARQVVDKIGHLCDYILFDSAWLGYEQFIPMMKACSPLLLELNADDPGIIVTQSVHKQQAGFSMASQIHKKDKHLKGQERYCNHKRFNHAFMLHASTSPFYPLFAALDVNAKMHEGTSGKRLWQDCVKIGIEARKMLLNTCKLVKPLIPPTVDGRRWQDYDTKMIANDLRFFNFVPGEKWHSFAGIAEQQYFIDPCKLLLSTPGIDPLTSQYSEFGIPATILAHFLRENGIIPEKSDLNSILFLLTPTEDLAKIQHLIAKITHFERYINEDALLSEVLPELYQNNQQRYQGYRIRRLCQEMHDLYVKHDLKQLQQEMFRKIHFPPVAMPPQGANRELVRGNVELVLLAEAAGKIAAEGALPYPPGIFCITAGEIWGGPVQRYFLAIEEYINLLPGFTAELQGVYIQQDLSGQQRIYGYVIKHQAGSAGR